MALGPRFLDAPQGSPLWFEHRAGHATASRFGDILAGGDRREAYKWQLVAERLFGIGRDGGGRAKEWGHEAEPLARKEYEWRTLNQVREVGFAVHGRIKWLGCSSDGLVDEQGSIEVKSPFNHAIQARTLLLGMPEEHKPQTQGNLWVLEREWIDFLSFDPSAPAPLNLYIERFTRDEDYIKVLEKEVKLFLAEVAIAVKEIKTKYH